MIRNEERMSTITYDSPIGRLTLIGDEHAVRELRFPGRDGDPARRADDDSTRAPLRVAVDQLDAYFAGELERFELDLELEGTLFQRRVWDALTRIPYGSTTTYGALARELGSSEPRAVGGAVARTPVPIVVPCHRVVGADGSLTGYGGGLDRKRSLLAFEASGGDVTTLRASWSQRQLALL
jgi:methylated-DNA-[protein]-cysteine S-methyltransferase